MCVSEPSFFIDIKPEEKDIDELGHVNNTVYVRWLEQCAWQHSKWLGLTLESYRDLDRAMAVIRHEIDYLASSYCGDSLQLTTWITSVDKLRVIRDFQLVNTQSRQIILKAKTIFCCIQMSTGKPKRMPEEFVACYGSALIKE